MTYSSAIALADPAPASPALSLSWMTGTDRSVPANGIAGVYIVWRTGRQGRDCLAVGEARDIAGELSRLLRESHIAGCAATGTLAVSWAAAASLHRRGIARWLAATLAPQLGRSAGVDRPIAVNLPA